MLLALFVPFLGLAPLFDWDEANFAEAAREMLVRGNFLQVTIGFEPFFEKPPLFLWVQAASMAAFGVNEWAARLPNALVGTATLVILFRIGAQINDRQFGYLWVLAYVGSILPGFYFRTGIIDPLFNLLMFLSIWNLIRWDMVGAGARPAEGIEGGGAAPPRAALQAWRYILLAGLWSGLAVLAKGPVGFGLPALSWGAFWLLYRRSWHPPVLQVLLFTAVAVSVGASWFLAEFLHNGPAFIRAFVAYQGRLLLVGEAGHGQPFYYHFVTTLIGCFPASGVAFLGLRTRPEMTDRQRAMHRWMVVVFCCVLIVFSLVTTKILHYVSLAYIPLAYLAALGMHALLRRGRPAPSALYRGALIAMATGWAAVMIGAPLALMWKDRWAHLVVNAFARANVLAPVAWSPVDVLPGAVMLAGVGAAVILFARRRWFDGHVSLFAATAGAAALLLVLAGPKIHEHTQGALVRFVRLAGAQDAYVHTLFHSYVQHLYARVTPERSAAGRDAPPGAFFAWLKTGAIDRPVYFVTRVRSEDAVAAVAVRVREENGFVLFRRDPPSASPLAGAR